MHTHRRTSRATTPKQLLFSFDLLSMPLGRELSFIKLKLDHTHMQRQAARSSAEEQRHRNSHVHTPSSLTSYVDDLACTDRLPPLTDVL